MQQFTVITAICTLFLFAAQAQDDPAANRLPQTVLHQPLELSTAATTMLIFPVAICEDCIDRGHPAIGTSAVAGVTNVLRVKAASDTLPPSNLTVFTIDGMIYTFSVRYVPNPHTYIHDFSAMRGPGAARYYTGRMNDADVATHAMVVAATRPQRHRPLSRTVGAMDLRLQHIFLKEGVMFLSMGLRNHSGIDYDVDFTRFYIRDRKRQRRTSAMELKIEALHELFSPAAKVPAGGSTTLVVALPKFTIADSKYFCIEVFEKGGDRLLRLRFKGKHLLNAKRFLTTPAVFTFKNDIMQTNMATSTALMKELKPFRMHSKFFSKPPAASTSTAAPV